MNTRSALKSHFVLIVIAAAAVLLLLLLWPQAVVSKKSLGECLTAKGVTMYGVDTCPNCVNQKKLFGEDFKNVHYVNCDFDQLLCQEKGITVYPIWSNGNKVLIGTQPLPDLASFAGCDYVE